MTENVASAADILGPNGSIAKRLPGYEVRQEQVAMAEDIERAVAAGQHLVVEAGTGVGKSFAYLIPAILAAHQRRDAGKANGRIIVSTHTISLQEQIIERDIPFLKSVLPMKFSAVLVKGRGNYISIRRTQRAAARNMRGSLFDDDGQRQLSRIQVWAQDTSDGSRADLGFRPLPAVWDEVGSDHGDCLKKACPYHENCFYYKARKRVWNADLLVVNHALFFSDLALRREGANILPDYDTVILDEAHTVESVAANHMGLSVKEGQFSYLLNRLYNDRSQRGILVAHRLNTEQRIVMGIRSACRDFFPAVADWASRFGQSNGRLDRAVEVPNQVTPRLDELATRLEDRAERLAGKDDQIELRSSAERCRTLAGNLASWCRQERKDCVYWLEHTGARRSVSLISAPIEVGPLLREHLFDEVPTVVLTSATLSVGSNDFSFFRSRVGVDNGKDSLHGSPFDYQRQARLIVSSNMPDPGSQSAAFQEACVDRIQRHLLATKGRAFVLFTSYSMLKFCETRMQEWLRKNQFTLYVQGGGLPRSAMLDQFRKHDRAVLFGTDSFWQGVDVQGDALQNVIIPRLPFSVPDHPLLQARVEAIKSRGDNPFREYQIPEAVIKLKQGFGRLIRSQADSGRVVILDPRILTKHYGKLFLASLPQCRTEIDDGETLRPLESPGV